MRFLDVPIGCVRFLDVPIGCVFVIDPPQATWATCKLVKLAKAPGWAMPEGWDFILADDTDAQDLTVRLLDEPSPI